MTATQAERARGLGGWAAWAACLACLACGAGEAPRSAERAAGTPASADRMAAAVSAEPAQSGARSGAILSDADIAAIEALEVPLQPRAVIADAPLPPEVASALESSELYAPVEPGHDLAISLHDGRDAAFESALDAASVLDDAMLAPPAAPSPGLP